MANKDPLMPALDFELPEDLTQLVSKSVQDEIRMETLRVHIKLLNRDPEFEGWNYNGGALQSLFDILASKLSNRNDFDQLLDDVIPKMVVAIRQELCWRYPSGDAETVKLMFLRGLILDWRLKTRQKMMSRGPATPVDSRAADIVENDGPKLLGGRHGRDRSDEELATAAKGASQHEIANRARRRQEVIMPILKKKDWKRGKLATAAGVGKGTAYEYLDGTRGWISFENGQAIADALEIEASKLPDVRPRT